MLVQSRPLLRALVMLAAAPLLVGSLGFRTNFDERVLTAHNRERDAVGVGALQWDADLATGAREWATYLSHTGKFQHSPDEPGIREGENIWGGTPGHYLPEAMIGLWIAEKKFFKPGLFPATSRSGRVEDVSHYTQLVWRSTTHVGCGVSSSGAEEVLVCRYRTAGNIVGQSVL